MPVMEPDLDAGVLKAWATAIDEGPFSSLCWGERIAFDNPDSLTLLGALAAWTERVQLVTTVIVPQLHDPVMCAKALATGDLLSGGRLTVGIGVGGRHEDYHAVGADPKTQTMREMADRVAVMRRVWAGRRSPNRCCRSDHRQCRRADRRCWSAPSARRPCVARRPGQTDWPASRWISTSTSRTSCSMSHARRGQRPESPHRTWRPHSGLRSAPVKLARVQVHEHLRRYMNWIPAEFVDAIAPTTGWAGSQDQLAATLRAFEAIGTDEIHLIPTSTDLDQLRQVADVVEDFA